LEEPAQTDEAIGGPVFWEDDQERPSAGPPASKAQPTQQQLMAKVQALERLSMAQQQSLNALAGRGATAASSPGGKVANVSKADFERCRKENRCLNCKEVGHVARVCTNAFRLKF
jgi:hypothetical protein